MRTSSSKLSAATAESTSDLACARTRLRQIVHTKRQQSSVTPTRLNCVSAPRSRHSRGIALLIVLISALIFSITALGVLALAVNRGRQITFVSEARIRARFAAEAGLVWATQRLWNNPTKFPSPCCNVGCAGTPQKVSWPIDTNADGVNDETVDITVTNCGGDRFHTLSAKVIFP